MNEKAIKSYSSQGVRIVNRDDILSDFWGHTYLVTVSRQGIKFLVNASYEGTAEDEVMDFIVENGWRGLYYTPDDPEYDEDNEFGIAGNYSYKFSTHNVRIEEL